MILTWKGIKMIAEKDWSIITDDKEKVELVINTILAICDPGTVEKKIVCKDSITVLFSDGTRIRWYKPFLNSLRGMKCSKLWCDKYVDERLIDYIRACYFGEDKDVIWI